MGVRDQGQCRALGGATSLSSRNEGDHAQLLLKKAGEGSSLPPATARTPQLMDRVPRPRVRSAATLVALVALLALGREAEA
jgi:hypothetical protein